MRNNTTKNLSKLLLMAGVALLGATLFAGKAQAHSYDHIDRTALQLERELRYLHREVENHCRPTPQYQHLHRDIAQMERLAHHIHDVAHRHGSLSHIRADLRQLDRLFHHVEDLVDDLGRSRRIDWRTLRHIRGAVAQVGRTLHHLQRDVNG